MNPRLRALLGKTLRLAALALILSLPVGNSSWATVQYLDDGALQDMATALYGWKLPPQGSCPAGPAQAYTGIDTRPECVAMRLSIVQASCTGNYAWTTSGVCNDLDATSQTACESKGDRLWNPSTAVCSVVMIDDDRNDVTCVRHGGTWVTTGTCTGAWIMPARTAYSPNLLTGTGPGDQCLRCHNTVTQYNNPRVRDTEDTLYMGHKNMARRVAPPAPWGGPPLACTNATYTTEEDCIHNGGAWLPVEAYPSDDAGNAFDWPAGTIADADGTNKVVKWIYGDWLSPLPRAITATNPASGNTCNRPDYPDQTTCTANGGTWLGSCVQPQYTVATCGANGGVWGTGPIGTCTDPTKTSFAACVAPAAWVRNAGASYACARCHTTGWTSDAAINSFASGNIEQKEPEATFPGITWDRVTDATFGKVNLAGGVKNDANRYASWDAFGVVCSRCHNSAIDTTKGDASTPTQYSAPTGMSSHHSNLTAADNTSGICSDSRWNAETQCTTAGGTWFTACSKTSAAVCVYSSVTTSANCTDTANGAVWVAGGFCSSPRYSDSASCTAAGFTWQEGWCKNTTKTQATCTGGTGNLALSWRVNGTQASCQLDAGTWSFPVCRDESGIGYVEGFCNKGTCSNPSDTNQINCEANRGTWTGFATKAACESAGGQFRNATDVIRCEDAGGRWSGTNSNRGPIITRVCMDCHRQETSGLPYDDATSGSGSYATSHPGQTLKVGPVHGTADYLLHFHGNQFLNSPHGKFTGTFDQIATATFLNGYGSFFQVESEAAGTGNGCTGCHEVHTSTVTGERPFRAECTECHSGPNNKDLTKINHLAGPGTPLEEMATKPFEACVTCHMPGGQHLFRINAKATYSAIPPAAFTGTVNANTDADAAGKQVVWVDLDAACGQCHGGGTSHAETTGSVSKGSTTVTVASTAGFTPNERIHIADAGNFEYDDDGPEHGDFETYIVSVTPPSTITLLGGAPFGVTNTAVIQNPTRNNAPYYTKAALAPVAEGMHASAGVNYQVTFGTTVDPGTPLTVDADATVNCGGACPGLNFQWEWGDSTSNTTAGGSASHDYAGTGSYTITLTAWTQAIPPLEVGRYARTVRLTASDLAPVADGACSANANATWTATDSSTDDGPDADTLPGDGDAGLKISVDWGDGSPRTVFKRSDTNAATHSYVKAGNYTIRATAIDTLQQSNTWTCAATATLNRFTLAGTVTDSHGVPAANAIVKIIRTNSSGSTTVVRKVYTDSLGAFTTDDGATKMLKAGTYKLKVSKNGYTFPPPLSYTVGPDVTGIVVQASTP